MQSPRPAKELTYPKELAEVLHLIDQGDRDTALKSIDRYLGRSEHLQWYGQAFYLQGRVYRGQKDYPKAIASFRKAIRHSSKYDSQVEAQSLYALAQTYELSEQYTHLITALLDLRRRGKYFSSLVEEVEIPARLAAAYAQAGQLTEAINWHSQAEKSLHKVLRSQAPFLSTDEVAKSHYYLGVTVFPAKKESFDQHVKKLKLGQSHFLAACEREGSVWAKRSHQRLLQSYQNLWEKINNPPLDVDLEGDPQGQAKHQQWFQLQAASDFYDLLLVFEEQRNPSTPVDSLAGQLLQQGRNWQTRLEKFVAQLSLGPELIRRHPVRNRPLPNRVELNEKPNPEPSIFKESSEAGLPPAPKKETAADDIGEDPNL